MPVRALLHLHELDLLAVEAVEALAGALLEAEVLALDGDADPAVGVGPVREDRLGEAVEPDRVAADDGHPEDLRLRHRVLAPDVEGERLDALLHHDEVALERQRDLAVLLGLVREDGGLRPVGEERVADAGLGPRLLIGAVLVLVLDDDDHLLHLGTVLHDARLLHVCLPFRLCCVVGAYCDISFRFNGLKCRKKTLKQL